jgi:glutamate-1-semialdehyde 2,1-aminomutase
LELVAREDPYASLDELAVRLTSGLRDAFDEASVPCTVNRVGSLFSLFFTDGPVRNYSDARAADHARYATFFHAMLERGIYLPPSGYEAWFIGTAHGESEIEQTIEAAKKAITG